MSFPKAKIHRFNEEITCAPPPGKYDPKLDTKVKGAVIDKSKRFVDQKVESGSTESLDSFLTKKGCPLSSSTSSSAVFRTPQPKKVLHTPSQNRIQCPIQTSTPYSTRSDSGVGLDSVDKDRASNSRSEIHRLEEKLKSVVNQTNSQLLEKSKEITSLKEQIESLSKTNEQLRDEIKEKKKILYECNTKLEKLTSELDSLNSKILTKNEDHRKQCEELEEEIQGLKICINTNVAEKRDLEDIITEKQAVLVVINDKYLSLESQLKKLENEKDELIASHANEIRDLLIKHEVELNSVATAAELNVHVMKTKLEAQVKLLATELDNAQSEIHTEYESKLKDITNDAAMQLQRIREVHQQCCDNILSIENMVSSRLNEFITIFKECDEKYESIVYERNKAEYERDELRVSNLEKTLAIIEIQELANDYKFKLEESLAKCKKYKITVTRMQETIKALSDRLFTSESDVEHLNEIKNTLRQELTELFSNMAVLEKNVIEDIMLLKNQLLNKLEMFKSEAAAEIGKLREELDKKQKTIEKLLSEVDFYQNKLSETVCSFEGNLQKQNLELADMKSKYQNLEEELYEKNVQFEMLNEEFKQTIELIHELQSLKLYHEGQIAMVVQKLDETQEWSLQARENLNILNSDNEEKTKAINLFKKEILTNKECIQSMVNELREKENHIEALLEQVNKVNSIENELRDKEKHIESLREQFNKANVITEEKEKYIDEMVSDLVLEKERCALLENEKCKLETKLLTAKEKLQALQSDNIEKARFIVEQSLKVDQLKDEKSEMNGQIEKLTEENKCLQSKLTEVENNLSCTENYANSKDTVIYDLERKLEEQMSVVAEKEEKINSLNTIIATQKNRLKDENNEMNGQIEALTEENKCLQSKLIEVENKLFCMENYASSKDTVIFDLERKLEEHLSVVAEKEEKINSLNTIIATQKNRLSEFNSISTRLSQLKTKNQHLEAEVSKNNKIICKLQNQNKEELSSLSEKFENQCNENVKLKQKLGEMNVLLEKERNVSENLELENCKSKLSEAESELMNKEHQLEVQRQLTAQLNSRLAELEENVRKIQEERLELIVQRDAAQKELKDLDQQLALALGHKNLKQKIRHINQVIESNTEMKLQLEVLSAENARLKKKSNKENLNVTNQMISVDNKSPKSIKKPSKTVKLPNSPSGTAAVLKDRNQV